MNKQKLHFLYTDNMYIYTTISCLITEHRNNSIIPSFSIKKIHTKEIKIKIKNRIVQFCIENMRKSTLLLFQSKLEADQIEHNLEHRISIQFVDF